MYMPHELIIEKISIKDIIEDDNNKTGKYNTNNHWVDNIPPSDYYESHLTVYTIFTKFTTPIRTFYFLPKRISTITNNTFGKIHNIYRLYYNYKFFKSIIKRINNNYTSVNIQKMNIFMNCVKLWMMTMPINVHLWSDTQSCLIDIILSNKFPIFIEESWCIVRQQYIEMLWNQFIHEIKKLFLIHLVRMRLIGNNSIYTSNLSKWRRRSFTIPQNMFLNKYFSLVIDITLTWR